MEEPDRAATPAGVARGRVAVPVVGLRSTTG